MQEEGSWQERSRLGFQAGQRTPTRLLLPSFLPCPSPFLPLAQQAEVNRARHFSACTVPMVIYSHYTQTYAEYFTGPPTWMWRMQVRCGRAAGGAGCVGPP